jgi:hypothetical protein
MGLWANTAVSKLSYYYYYYSTRAMAVLHDLLQACHKAMTISL